MKKKYRLKKWVKVTLNILCAISVFIILALLVKKGVNDFEDLVYAKDKFGDCFGIILTKSFFEWNFFSSLEIRYHGFFGKVELGNDPTTRIRAPLETKPSSIPSSSLRAAT